MAPIEPYYAHMKADEIVFRIPGEPDKSVVGPLLLFPGCIA